MNDFRFVIEKIHDYVFDLMNQKLDSRHKFHNWEHTQAVVKESDRLAKFCKLDDEERSLLKIAAYFHDAGHVSCYTGHEEASVDIANKYLSQFDFSKRKTDMISSLILSTKLSKNCSTLMERVLHDADLSHVGKLDMAKWSNKLREEWEYCLKRKYTDKEWLLVQIDFLSNLRFCTKPAKKLYDETRKYHVEKLSKQLTLL